MVYVFLTEIDKFKHEVEEVLHDVEEVFNDVKEHVILSVRDFSLQIAFILMGVTSMILVIGTVYVWCFHHPKNAHVPEREVNEFVSREQKSENDAQNTSISRENSVESNSGIHEQNGQVRKRTTSGSNANNNNSPVKSKIPVRTKTKAS